MQVLVEAMGDRGWATKVTALPLLESTWDDYDPGRGTASESLIEINGQRTRRIYCGITEILP